jgi:DNA helicase II / ATP-dependent DNA helicase PcrA
MDAHDDSLAMLSSAQRRAVEHRSTPLLVVAGPGSGKTRVLTHRIAGLIADGGRPYRIAAVTFTNKAAAEMRTRVSDLVGPAGDEVLVATFHSFCLRLLRRHHDEVGLPRWFSVLDSGDQEKVLRQVIAELGGDPTDARTFGSKISFAKNTGADRDLPPTTAGDAALREVWSGYEQRCRLLGAVDFDDLLCLTRTVLHGPSAAEIQGRYDSILVDEWQDTNAVQYDIVAALAGPARTGRDVMVVGDPMQSIYSWRGSSPVVTERFIEDFAPTVIELGENYRSSAKIVAVADAVAASSSTAHRATLSTSNPAGADVELWTCDDPDGEASRVVAELRRRSGTRAVLVRTNAQTRVFETALAAAGIAHQVVGTVRFTDRAEVKDALAYLKVCTNPADALAFARAANTPRRKLGEKALDAFLARCDELSVAPGVAVADPTVLAGLKPMVARGFAAFAEALATIRTAMEHGSLDDVVHAVLDSGLRAFHAAEPDRVENLNELVAAAQGFLADRALRDPDGLDLLDGPAVVEAFIQTMSLSSSSDQAEPNPVSVITAHASKGREFDHVFVVGAEEDIMPHALASNAGELDEERRLFFVAVSRARSGLVVSHRHRHFVNGTWRNATRSQFIDAIVHLCHQDRPRPVRSRYATAAARPFPNSRPAPGFAPPQRTAPRPPVPVAGPRLDPAAAPPGTRVRHEVFGVGTVHACAGSMATIEFAGKCRNLDLQYAPLALLD